MPVASQTALTKCGFFRFVVTLPEKGDVDGMAAMLREFSEHRDELLTGVRPGVDRSQYSAMAYATWLCQFEDYSGFRGAVRRLIEQGLPEDICTAIALDEAVSSKPWFRQTGP